MARVALIGASGQVGTRILHELSFRGHSVTAIARNPEKIPLLKNVTIKSCDVNNIPDLTSLLRGHDAVVSSVKFASTDPKNLVKSVKDSDVNRYLIVGGAGSLFVSPGQRLIDQSNFPEIYKPEASIGATFLEILKGEVELDWTFLSPSAEFMPGERTNHFRIGGDFLLSNQEGSSISFEDYAVAMVDEIENPKHSRQRFTVGY